MNHHRLKGKQSHHQQSFRVALPRLASIGRQAGRSERTPQNSQRALHHSLGGMGIHRTLTRTVKRGHSACLPDSQLHRCLTIDRHWQTGGVPTDARQVAKERKNELGIEQGGHRASGGASVGCRSQSRWHSSRRSYAGHRLLRAFREWTRSLCRREVPFELERAWDRRPEDRPGPHSPH